MKKALITGITGQDGSYLAELLIENGIEVHGIVRRNSAVELQRERIEHIIHKINIRYGDMSDFISLWRAVEEIKPDYLFNLAAISQVRTSYDVPQYTLDVNGNSVQVLLDACRKHCPDVRFYQASSSEIFGQGLDDDGYQRETTLINPSSPYAIGKVIAYNFVRHYRRAYGMHASNGILFNHESPRRGGSFVTQKVARAAVEIKLGLRDKLELGNLDSYRDWGHAKDYVKAMLLITNHIKGDDFVIATGDTHSVREMCDLMFGYVGLDYRDYVTYNEKYLRPEEVPYLRGDSTRAEVILGWQREYDFATLMKEMVDHWLNKLK
jgi:GDPmannose 4,6-dehydratase